MAFPQETLLARYAFSQALSRSTALSALEVSLDDYLTSMALLPRSLAKTGRPGMRRTQLIKKLGELMKFRQGLNLNRENFSEVPDFYWAEPELERIFILFLILLQGSLKSILVRLFQVIKRCIGSKNAYSFSKRQNYLCC
jgi:uncharacterized Rmd1/YagE family protein